MKLDFNRKYTTIAVYAFLVLAAVLLFYSLLRNFGLVLYWGSMIGYLLMPFIYAFCIAYLLNPMMKFFETHLMFVDKKNTFSKLRRACSLCITYLIAALAVTFFMWVTITQIKDSLITLANKIQQWLPAMNNWLHEVLRNSTYNLQIDEQINAMLNTVGNWALKYSSDSLPTLLTGAKNITAGVTNLILGVIISIYMLYGKEHFSAQIRKLLTAFLKERHTLKITRVFSDAHKIFSGFIIGKLLDSLIIGILCFVGMLILHLPFASLVSFLVGITNVIPYFGAFFGAILGGLIILVISPMQALWFMIFILVLQQFDGNILGPKILGNSIGISAFWVIFAILVGGGLFGVPGMLFGVPAFALIYAFIRSFINHRLDDKLES